jgi:hypothetical protein
LPAGKGNYSSHQEVDHVEDFYRPSLEGLGYELHEAYRRGQDAVVVAFKRELFSFKGKEIVDYNELVKLFEGTPGLSMRDFKVNNKALICHLEHVTGMCPNLSL